MYKVEFEIVSNYVSERIKKERPFVITSSELFNVIVPDIQFSRRHRKVFNEFLEHYYEAEVDYNITPSKPFVNFEFDRQFDIEFY